MANFRPLNNQILVDPVEEDEKTESGIILLNRNNEPFTKGTVLAIGTNENLDIEVGDTILYSKFGGTQVQIEGKDLLIMTEDNIVGVLG